MDFNEVFNAFFGAYIETLRQKDVLTPRQKDILDTEDEALKIPFDRTTAIGQIRKNCLNYRELGEGISALTVVRECSIEQMSDSDIVRILQSQTAVLLIEEIVSIYSSQQNR